jgi:hypothetical protein
MGEAVIWFAMQAYLEDCLLIVSLASGGRESHRSQGEQKGRRILGLEISSAIYDQEN